MNLTPDNTSYGKLDFRGSEKAIMSFTVNREEEDKAHALPDIIAGELSNAFALLDPALAELHQNFQLAKLSLSEAKKSGKGADVAKWRFETAESAYQTRLYEVRKNSLLKEIEAGNEDNTVKKELHGLTMQQRMNEEFALLRKKRLEEKRRKEEKSQGGFFFYFMLGLYMAQLNADKRARELEATKLQTHFFNARTA